MPVATPGRGGRLHEALDALEKRMIVEALLWSRGYLIAAAEYLGITERIMGLRVRKYALDRRTYRGAVETAGSRTEF